MDQWNESGPGDLVEYWEERDSWRHQERCGTGTMWRAKETDGLGARGAFSVGGGAVDAGTD